MNRKERRARGIDIGDTTVRYGGRTLELWVVINTDETLEQVVARVAPAAKGPAQRMVVVTGGEMPASESKELWEKVIPQAEQQAKSGGEA